MGILMHCSPENVIELLEFVDERAGGNLVLVGWMRGNGDEKGSKGGEQR